MFAPKLIQDSPQFKSNPRELKQTIKLGAFDCNIQSEKVTMFGSTKQRPQQRDPISVGKIFTGIKDGLHVSQSQPNQVQLVSNIAGFGLARAIREHLCYRCLAPGHNVRDCKEQIRCWCCYNYGHRKRECTKWRSFRRIKWAPRPSTVQDVSIERPSLEPRTAQSDGTDSCPALTQLPAPLHSIPDPQHQNTLALSLPLPNQAEHQETNQAEGMANCAINPLAFTPTWMFIEDGGPLRKARREVHISGRVQKKHEDYAIAISNEQLTTAQKADFMHQIRPNVQHEVRKSILHCSLHPHGVGIFQFGDVCERDILVNTSPHFINYREFSFAKHDEAPMNQRFLCHTRQYSPGDNIHPTRTWLALIRK